MKISSNVIPTKCIITRTYVRRDRKQVVTGKKLQIATLRASIQQLLYMTLMATLRCAYDIGEYLMQTLLS